MNLFNQFGEDFAKLGKVNELCVPSEMTLGSTDPE